MHPDYIDIRGGPYGTGSGSGIGISTVQDAMRSDIASDHPISVDDPPQIDTFVGWIEANPVWAVAIAAALVYIFIGQPKVGQFKPRD